jgi:hypothetical protein
MSYTAEEIVQQGTLVETVYHEYSAVNKRPEAYIYQLENQRAKVTLGFEGGSDDWYFTGQNTMEVLP